MGDLNPADRMNRPIRILHIEDLPSDAYLVGREIRKVIHPCEIKLADTEESFVKNLKEFIPDIILSDISLPEFDWQTAFHILRQRSPMTPFIIVTGSTSLKIVAGCLNKGATDVICKENIHQLAPAILNALKLI
jgi:CheY-like chemotaxis protein